MPAYTNTVTSTHQDFTWTGTTGSFDNIALIPGIEYSAQLEVERQFALDINGSATIAAFLGSEFVSTQDKRQVFVIPNQYITYNTTNKTITGFTLSNYVYTYYLTTDLNQSSPQYIYVPNISTSVNTLFTVRRKSISNQALVTWADGGKLTSSQLNLQTQQLLFLAQETADRINTELSNATDIAYAIADGAITYTKILGDGVNAWNFASPIITISPTSNLHATTRLYTLNSIYNHGVITKDDTAPTSSAVDILETAATAGNSGIWFDPKLGQLQVWAGNAWVALVGVPLSTNNIVDIGSTQIITGAKTFSSPLGATTFSSTLGVTGATTLSSTLGVTGATTLASVGVTGAATVGTTLGVTGAATLSSTLGVTGAATFNSTDYLKIPVGTTAQRPTSLATGQIRMNSSLERPEWYSSIQSEWLPFSFDFNYGTQKAIFGYGYNGGNVSMTNLVSNTGIVATDTTGVGSARYSLSAAGYGTDKAIFGYGYTGAVVSMTNLVSNTGVVATDTTGVGSARYSLSAAGYGTDKAIFGYGYTGAYVSMTNLVSNTGIVATDTTGIGTARYGLSAAGYAQF